MNVPKVMLSVSTVIAFSSIVAISPRSLRRLASQMRHQDPHWPLAHGIRLQGSESPGSAVDPVRCQSVRLRTGGEKEMALRVQAKGAGPLFGCDVPDGRQPTGGGVY